MRLTNVSLRCLLQQGTENKTSMNSTLVFRRGALGKGLKIRVRCASFGTVSEGTTGPAMRTAGLVLHLAAARGKHTTMHIHVSPVASLSVALVAQKGQSHPTSKALVTSSQVFLCQELTQTASHEPPERRIMQSFLEVCSYVSAPVRKLFLVCVSMTPIH